MMSKTQQTVLEAIVARVIGNDKGGIILPFFIGGYLDSLLLGFSIIQMFKYRNFLRRDKTHIIVLVVLAFASTVASSLLGLLWMISLFSTNFGLYLPFAGTKWLWRHIATEVICVLFVQAFYIDRAYRLWKSLWPIVVLAPFSLATTVLGCLCMNNYAKMDYFTLGNLDHTTNALMYSLFSLIIASDMMITGVLSWGLFRQKTGWKHTDSLLRRLIYRCCETQLFALISALVIIAVWSNTKTFGVSICIMLFQTKIYYLGLQITLNSRIGSSSVNNVTHLSKPMYTTKGPAYLGSDAQFADTTHSLQQGAEDHTSTQDLVDHADALTYSGDKKGSSS